MTEFTNICIYLKEARMLYNDQVLNTTSSFHTQEMSLKEFRKIVVFKDGFYESYAILSDGKFAGYVLFCPFNLRQAYKRTAEATIYLKKEFRGTGTASTALEFIEKRAGQKGVKNMIAKITAENIPSVKFFEKSGYRLAGTLEDVGEKFGRILSVAIYQKEIWPVPKPIDNGGRFV